MAARWEALAKRRWVRTPMVHSLGSVSDLRQGRMGGAARKMSRCGLVPGLFVLVLVACNIQPVAFANGSAKALGPVSVAMEVQPNPPRIGQATQLLFTLRNSERASGPAPGSCELVLDMPKMPMNMSRMTLDIDAGGRCQTSYVFPMAGGWSAAVKLNGQEGAQGNVTFEFDVGP